MSTTLTPDSPYGELVEPATLRLQRTLPGPAERIWAYLVDSELRRQWLASGTLEPHPGASFELVWRNDELSDSPSERPEGFAEESRATCRVTEVVPLRRLGFDWPGVGEVTIELEPRGREVLLTLTHRKLPDARLTTMVGAGWHAHLDVLVARAENRKPPSLWARWRQLHEVYARRVDAAGA